MKSILFIHGWLHSCDVFSRLVTHFTNCEIHCLEIDGFDNDIESDLAACINSVREHLLENRYDVIVAHSLGCLLLLNALDIVSSSKVLLLNPVYNNYKLIVRICTPLLLLMPWVKVFYGKHPNSIFVKLPALLTCNSYGLIDKDLLDGIAVCNPKTVYITIADSLTFQCININSSVPVSVVYSNKDRLLLPPNQLINSLNCTVTVVNGGHTSFVEEESLVVCVIRNLLI